MFKWVACLCVTLYFTLLIFGAPPEGEDQVASVETQAEQAPAVQPAPQPVEVAAVEAPRPEPAPVAATEIVPAVVTESLDPAAAPAQSIADIAKTLKPTRVAPPKVELASATPEPTPEPEPTNGVGEIWRVTGSAVNLRAGASTQFAVLGRATRGDSAEVMEILDNGWAKVYVLENGVEAYMSADFLARETQ